MAFDAADPCFFVVAQAGGMTSLPAQPSALRVLLLGANGFIGSHVLAALLQRGHLVVGLRRSTGTRAPVPELARAEQTGQLRWRAAQLQALTTTADWLDHGGLDEVDVAINCAGILRQRWGESYVDVHHLMPAALAQACAQKGVRLLHTSALGLHEHAKSRFLSSKLAGEKAVKASGAKHCIVRPSLIDGWGGFGASWLRMLARWPVHFVPRGATGRIAAVRATDLGEAYAALAERPTLADQAEANLGGDRHFAYGEYLQLLRGVEEPECQNAGRAKPALQVPLPNWVTRIGAHLCDAVRFSPFSYGHWILLQRDNLPVPNHLPDLLGRAPAPVTYERVGLSQDFRLS